MEFLFNGGLQIRSKSSTDPFFNTETFTNGELALHKLYPNVNETDIPIAQDCFGDQFIIRDNIVYQLEAETGDISSLEVSWDDFLSWISEDPIERLNISDDLSLTQGNLLFAYPPFCTKEGSNASIKEVDGREVILAHAEMARQIGCLEDGQAFEVKIVD